MASFAGWQTAALNVLKRTLPGPQGLVGAAGKVCRGLSGAWELQGRVAPWGLASFAGWQTAALNVLKKDVCHGLRDLGAAGKVWQTAALKSLKGHAWELQGRVAGWP